MLIISCVFTLFSLTALAAGIYVLSVNRKSRLNILFSLICFILSVSFFCENLINYITEKENALSVYYTILFFTNLFFPLNIHFLFELTKEKPLAKKLYLLIYVPFPAVTVLSIFFRFPWSDLVRIDNSYWKHIPSTGNPGLYLYLAYGIIYFGISLWLLYAWRKSSKSVKVRRQSLLMMTGLLFFMFSGIVFNMILQALPSYNMPMLSIINASLYLFSILISLTRYRFLSIDSKTILDEVLSNLDEPVFLLDVNANLLQANKTGNEKLGIDRAGIRFRSIIVNHEYVGRIIQELISGDRRSGKALIIYKGKSGSYVTDSYLTGISDKFSDLLAILIVSRHNARLSRLKEEKKITNRELEIIFLSMLGHSGKEIAELLGTSPRTVDHHHAHIYDKLNVANKTDLLKITRGDI